MELSDYAFLSAPKVNAYNHLGNKLSSLVAVANADADQETVHGISMQVAAMAPIALDADHVAQEVKDKELAVAIEKTKQDEVNKAVENALRKVVSTLHTLIARSISSPIPLRVGSPLSRLNKHVKSVLMYLQRQRLLSI